MRTVIKLTDFKFINIYNVQDLEKNVNGYFYAERLGKDSIAFICYDRNTKKFLLNNEFKPPVDKFICSAFGGSLDNSNVPYQVVISEVQEEAGFEVGVKDIYFLGRSFVSTQMNQYCYLYIVFVDKNNESEKHPENDIEAMATTLWMKKEEVFELEDWKSITIVVKAEAKGII